MWAEAWLEELPRALRSVWAGALGSVPLDVWWANGDRERTYTVGSWLPTHPRRLALCWYAALDPEPSSPRVTAAVNRAFRGATEHERRWLIGVMPLGSDELAKLARSHRNDYAARLMLRARERADVVDPPPRNGDEERPLREAWQAAHLKQSLSPAWTAALGHGWRSDWQMLDRLLILPTRVARAWSALPRELRESQRAQAAFVAALSSGEEAELVLGPAGASVLAHCRAALATREVPPRWAELIRGADDPTVAFEEGLYTAEEWWTILAGKAACARDRDTELDAVLVRMMVASQRAAVTWANDAQRRLSGARDEAEITKTLGRITKELATEQPRQRQIMKQLNALSAAGGRNEAVSIVWELERRNLTTYRPAVHAEGRSLALLAEGMKPNAEGFVAALAADGHLDEVRKHLPPLLNAKPPAETLLEVARAIVLLEPDAAEFIGVQLVAGLETLPGASADEARAWLSGSPDD